jgi:hypothetical protein
VSDAGLKSNGAKTSAKVPNPEICKNSLSSHKSFLKILRQVLERELFCPSTTPFGLTQIDVRQSITDEGVLHFPEDSRL